MPYPRSLKVVATRSCRKLRACCASTGGEGNSEKCLRIGTDNRASHHSSASAFDHRAETVQGAQLLHRSPGACPRAQTAPNEIAYRRDSRMFTACGQISMNQIRMGALIGCPNRWLSTESNFCRNRNLNWGTHKSRTRGSLSRAGKIASD